MEKGTSHRPFLKLEDAEKPAPQTRVSSFGQGDGSRIVGGGPKCGNAIFHHPIHNTRPQGVLTTTNKVTKRWPLYPEISSEMRGDLLPGMASCQGRGNFVEGKNPGSGVVEGCRIRTFSLHVAQ